MKCLRGFMPNSIKKSMTVSTANLPLSADFFLHLAAAFLKGLAEFKNKIF